MGGGAASASSTACTPSHLPTETRLTNRQAAGVARLSERRVSGRETPAEAKDLLLLDLLTCLGAPLTHAGQAIVSLQGAMGLPCFLSWPSCSCSRCHLLLGRMAYGRSRQDAPSQEGSQFNG